MEISKHLDEKNQRLLIDRLKYFTITFQEDLSVENCSVYIQNKEAVLFYNPRNFNNDSIAHELLHIWLKKYKYHIGNPIFLTFQYFDALNEIFNKELCDHIGNCFDHFKMYPEYLKMGYSPERFVENGLEMKCSIDQILDLDMNSNIGIESYIGHLISIKADHIQHDYKKHLDLFKNLDSELFIIINEFWLSWTIFDIKTIDPIFNSDAELVSNFTDRMKNWFESKNKN